MDAEIDRLIALHADKAYAVALRITGDPTVAGDVVQEAFLRAMKYFATYDPTLPFEAWLNQILRNVYLTSLRQEAARRSVSLSAKADEDSASLEDALADLGPGPERWAEARENTDRVQYALSRLTPPLRLAVAMVDLEGSPREEAAAALGCSLSALDVRLHRGRQKLKELLS
ncbi:MAG: sigma-70 family RNA polymerase sigma factor [Elusimicrobia bacterium]|nr:sigma-70 family RNA polymerase sigma factor [Elusimicrobiota bacterium]